MKNNLLTTLLLLTLWNSTTINSQETFCTKTFDNSYFPLLIGLEKKLTWGSAVYTEKINETQNINGQEYYKYLQDFGNGKSYDLLLRKNNDTVFIYNEKEKNENILLIEKLKLGTKWNRGKKKSKIIDTNGRFESPFCYYENLLVIENKFANGKKENRYYKKGVGLVAVKSNNQINGMLIPTKDEQKRLSKPLAAIGCENLKTRTEADECNRIFINSYISEKLKLYNYKSPKEYGDLKFKVTFSYEGKVEKVEKLNKLKGGNEIRKTIAEILYSLPKFRPAMTTETKSIKSVYTFNIPIQK